MKKIQYWIFLPFFLLAKFCYSQQDILLFNTYPSGFILESNNSYILNQTEKNITLQFVFNPLQYQGITLKFQIAFKIIGNSMDKVNPIICLRKGEAPSLPPYLLYSNNSNINKLYADVCDEYGKIYQLSNYELELDLKQLSNADLYKKWYITFYALSNLTHIYKFQYWFENSLAQSCPNNCLQQLNQGLCNYENRKCVCSQEYFFGRDCAIQAFHIMQNQKYQFTLLSQRWQYVYFNLEKDKYFIKLLQNTSFSLDIKIISGLKYQTYLPNPTLTSNNNILHEYQINRFFSFDNVKYNNVLIAIFNNNTNSIQLSIEISDQQETQIIDQDIFQTLLIIIIVSGSFLGIVIIGAISWVILRSQPKLQIQDIKQILEQYLPIQLKEQQESQNEFVICAICQGDIMQMEKFRTTICQHQFHSQCFDTWYLNKQNCPTCRKDLSIKSLQEDLTSQRKLLNKTSSKL